MPEEIQNEARDFVARSTGESEGNQERVTFEDLPARLGFVESVEQNALRQQLVGALKSDAPETGEIAARYQEAAEATISQLEGDAFSLAQIGLIVQRALIYREAGMPEAAEAELQDARTYAEGLGRDDIVAALEQT